MTKKIRGIEDAPDGSVNYLVVRDTRENTLEILDVARLTELNETLARIARGLEKRREIRDIYLTGELVSTVEGTTPTFDYYSDFGRPVETTYRNAGLGVVVLRIQLQSGEWTTGLIRLETNAEQDVTGHRAVRAWAESAPTYLESFVYWDE